MLCTIQGISQLPKNFKQILIDTLSQFIDVKHFVCLNIYNFTF